MKLNILLKRFVIGFKVAVVYSYFIEQAEAPAKICISQRNNNLVASDIRWHHFQLKTNSSNAASNRKTLKVIVLWEKYYRLVIVSCYQWTRQAERALYIDTVSRYLKTVEQETKIKDALSSTANRYLIEILSLIRWVGAILLIVW